MKQKLKEIREKWFPPKYFYKVEGSGTPDCYPKEIIFNDTEFSKTQDQIQKETYLLALSEVEKWAKSGVTVVWSELLGKLTQLRNEIEK